MRTVVLPILLAAVCLAADRVPQPADPLYEGFRDPPAEARPFVRWWWNGNRITEDEVLRELDLLQKAGVGGVEINPIALHDKAPKTDIAALEWLSPEWNRVFRTAVQGCQDRGMIADVIVGSGWPFGGEFLTVDQTIQGVGLKKIPVRGPDRFEGRVAELLSTPGTRFRLENAPAPKLLFVRLVPEGVEAIDDCIELEQNVGADGVLRFEVPDGEHMLCIGATQHSFREVMHGAPGAAGPVVDHYNREAVERYLARMSETLGPVLGGQLGDGIRAMFCDSIELSGANWTEDLVEEFRARRGYDVSPYLPFVVDARPPAAEGALADTILRVRYDFSRTLVELFRERFIVPFHNWCNENGTLSRYQAYGFPWLMGMLDGYTIPDIPEGDTWLFNNWMGLDEIRYAVWNKYASSGGHLTGRRLIGCEAITNTSGVFRATLEYIKQGCDLSFITGVNHFILHGFNYSPPEAGFPGWIRYGTYLSEQNPWWPYFRLWADYNARLSWIFQQSEPVVQVAILGPEADIWSQHGLDRGPFVHQPEYLHYLWQAVHQNGCSADYLSETVLQNALIQEGRICMGPMRYPVLLLADVQSIQPETARAIHRFAEGGGRIVFIGKVPSRNPSRIDAADNDEIVREQMRRVTGLRGDRVLAVDAPALKDLRTWMDGVLDRVRSPRSVRIDRTDERLFQIHHRAGGRDVFLFTNMHRDQALDFTARFDVREDCYPWRWDPETGLRTAMAYTGSPATVPIHLERLESLLIVFEPGTPEQPQCQPGIDLTEHLGVLGPWRIAFQPVQDETFTRTFGQLPDMAQSDDPALSTFGGDLVYEAAFSVEDPARWSVLDLGAVHGVSEVSLSGQSLGVRWWGRHAYDLGGRLKKGENRLEIRVATVLANYCRSLTDNPMAATWTARRKDQPAPIGLLGPIRLYAETPQPQSTASKE